MGGHVQQEPLIPRIGDVLAMKVQKPVQLSFDVPLKVAVLLCPLQSCQHVYCVTQAVGI